MRQTAAAAPAVQTVGRHAQKTLCPHAGERPHVSRRQAVACHLAGRGAGLRTQAQISARLALDRWREAQAAGRQQTLASLHHARAG